MGNIQTKSELPDKKNFHILDYGYCKAWKRKLDQKEIMEEYPIYIQSEERLKIFQNVWPLRTNHPIFVNVYHFTHSQQGNFCTSTAKGSLFTQRIPYRLSQFGNIKYPEIVKVLRTCIEGYKILYENFGVFKVRSTMIGFTQDFRVKFWFHTDFSQPQPQNPNCKGLQEMFISLINAVQSTCEYLYYNCPRFSQFIVQTNYVYFSKDFDLLMKGLDDYVKKLGLKIPGDLKHLKSHLKKPQGWEKFKAKNNYPKLLISQTEIFPDSTTVPQLTEKKMQAQINSKDLVKKQQILLPYPQLRKSSSNHNLQNGINDRVISSKIQLDPYLIQAQNPKIHHFYSPPKNIKVQNNPQFLKIEQPTFRKSSENFIVEGIKNPPKMHRISTQTNEPKRYSQQISFNNPSNQYFGESTQNSKNLSSKRSSQTKNENFPRKSFDLSTETRNRNKSFESQLSLIEDLETQAKKKPSSQNFYYK